MINQSFLCAAAFMFLQVSVVLLFLNHDTTLLKDDSKSLSHKSVTISSNDKSSIGQCLTFEEDLDKIIPNTRQTLIAMPAKAAGTGLEYTTKECMQAVKNDISPQLLRFSVDEQERMFKSQLVLPKVIASHVVDDKNVIDAIQNSSKDTLIIYVYRDETDRIISAAKHMLLKLVCPRNPKAKSYSRHGFDVDKIDPNGTLIQKDDDGNCVVDENLLISLMKDRVVEIGSSVPATLTCDVYKAIEEHGPNMIMMDYKQADNLQTTIFKHYCPSETSGKNPNGHRSTDNIFIALENPAGKNDSRTKVPIEEWLDAKRGLMEFILKMNKDASCQARTKYFARRLTSCSDSLVRMNNFDWF
mmetsp:Transcript_9463/g.11020  ORF Transcript_9463/g.11020 Transcript_9463/m.11020 type:complete len:357 (+) Transcript_9463:115-1185(+)